MNKTRFKLIALDMDGTLLTDDKQVTKETAIWINKAIDEGIKVLFTTGRGLQTAKQYWDELGLESPMVLVNGAEIWQGRGELHKRIFLPQEEVRRLYQLAVEEHDVEWFWGYSRESLTGLDEWTDEMFDRRWMKIGIASEDVSKLCAIRKRIDSWGTIEITSSSATNLELSVKGVTKASGMREVCDLFGVSMSEVIAMGDSDNDVKLLQAAGFGVAMGNSFESVKAVADAVTETNNEDGVAKAIQKYVFGLD